jgi:hypothetical protein
MDKCATTVVLREHPFGEGPHKELPSAMLVVYTKRHAMLLVHLTSNDLLLPLSHLLASLQHQTNESHHREVLPLYMLHQQRHMLRLTVHHLVLALAVVVVMVLVELMDAVAVPPLTTEQQKAPIFR